MVRSAPGLAYLHLPAEKFYRRALERLDTAGVELRLGAEVRAVLDEGDHVRVETDAGPLRASLAFDSRPTAPRTRPGEVTLLQHFEGWHVRLEGAALRSRRRHPHGPRAGARGRAGHLRPALLGARGPGRGHLVRRPPARRGRLPTLSRTIPARDAGGCAGGPCCGASGA
ncbi:MAG: lycopene cyclase family protein [Sandaracinaceae bacterium]|nr:lycopene cyclase family protein [Sandaracinaceae bacterium]